MHEYRQSNIKCAPRLISLFSKIFIPVETWSVATDSSSDFWEYIKSRGNPCYEDLLAATCLDRLETAGALLDAGVKIRNSGIWAAVAFGSLNTTKFLIENGIDFSSEDLYLVVGLGGELESIELLIKNGARVVDKTICMAALDGRIEVLNYLLTIHGPVSKGSNSVYLASNRGHLDAVKALVAFKADVNLCGSFDYPIEGASRWGHINVVKYLAELGADINLAFGGAAIGGHIDIIKHIVESGADVNYVDGYGKTPLFYSLRHGNDEVTKFLIENGANPHQALAHCG